MSKFKKNKYVSSKGKFLVSSPNMGDPRFKQTIIFMISDSEEGSMGIIVNKPALNIDINTLLTDIKLPKLKNKTLKPKVFYGGPVELDKGFILHSNDYRSPYASHYLGDNLAISNDLSVMVDIVKGKGPSKSIFTIGYAGWDSYQLKNEIYQNSWIEIELDKNILFSKNHSKKWEIAMSQAGIKKDYLIKNAMFSPFSGSA